MAQYAAELTNVDADGRGEVSRVIVATPEWAEQNLGGTWTRTSDPYTDDGDPVVYCGPGFKRDPGVPEQFTGDIWEVSKATTQQSDGDGGWFWFYNTQGQLTWHEPTGKIWRNLLPDGSPNTFEPGVANWREYPLDNGVPVWVQPTGAFDAYPIGFVVKHEGGRYRSLIPANTTLPTNAQFWEELDAPLAPELPAWEPWPGFGPLYQIGDQVTHNGQTWESTTANNSWEPGVFGWVVVT